MNHGQLIINITYNVNFDVLLINNYVHHEVVVIFQ